MKNLIVFILSITLVLESCTGGALSKIDGLSDDVYMRGMEFISYMDSTPMIGQKEGEDMLNAIAEDGAPDSDALYEDVIYILWVYHNLKCIDSAAEEINKTREKLGINTTVQQEYQNIRNRILEASDEKDLWDIWNSISKR